MAAAPPAPRPPKRGPTAFAGHPRVGDEAGFALIEVIVSAALLITIAVGVFAGIDGPAKISGNGQARAIAASLAQQDQDQLRSRPVSALGNSQTTRTQAAGDVTYTVTSTTQWVSDASGNSPSCTSSSSSADYLSLTSTVTWPAIGTAAPVKVKSLMAPPASSLTTRGNLSFQLQDQAGNAVTGVPVSINASGWSPVTTDSLGCAFFGYLPTSSTYHGQFSQPGYVDPLGNNTVTTSDQTLAAGATDLVPLKYARAAQVAVSFSTRVGGVSQPAQGQSVTFTNGSLPSGTLSYPASGPTPMQSSLTDPSLFPFTDGYGVYAGSCSSNDPGPGSRATVSVQPGGNATVTVLEPTLGVTFTGRSGVSNVKFYPYQQGSPGCSATFPQTTANAQQTATEALPYGQYTVCVDNGSNHYTFNSPVANTTAAGSSYTLNDPGWGHQSGACP